MKKLSIAFAVASVLVGVSYAASNTVETVLGYTKITIPTNQYVLVSLDFNNESNTISGLFGGLPTGTRVYTWNTTVQNYNTFLKTRSGWGAPGTNKIQRGMGAFVMLPTGVQTNMILSGIVPTAGTTTVYKANGYSMISYPYPVLVAFTNTALAKTAAIGDRLSVWQNNAWKVYLKSRGGWLGAEGLQIKPGQAFFFQSATGGSANEIRPYAVN
ncbi:MAG: hypothetical protein WCG03_04410 [Kiritimatiellales bacterium]